VLAAILFATIHVAAMPDTSPSPSPAPTPRFDLKASGSNVFIDQATGGRGITPPEGPRFANGSPISPMSPYDWFTGSSGLELGATFGLGGLTGSTTNALYWGEPLIPNLNDHGLSRNVPYAILFPTHAGQDDASVASASLLSAWAGAAHHFSAKLLAVGGYGRFETTGRWAVTSVDAIYGVGFAGVQLATGTNTALLVEGKRYALAGLPSIPHGPPPMMRGTALIVDQKIGL
jgi:hypothetical protein